MAIATNTTWPFVTVPQFESQASRAVNDAQSSIVALLPLVQTTQRVQWERYAIANQGWVQDGVDYRDINSTAKPIVEFIYQVGQNGSAASSSSSSSSTQESGRSSPEMVMMPASSSYPHLEDGDNNGTLSYFSPIWQHSPITPNPRDVNYDAFNYSAFRPVYDTMASTNEAVLSEVLNYDRMPQTKRNISEEEITEALPQVFLAQPIFDVHKEDKRRVVGTILGLQQWHKLFVDLVPDEIDGVVVVVQNACQQSVTYQINGPKVYFLGYGDHHDKSYDYLEETTMLTEFAYVKDCQYSFHVYPSSTFEKAYLGREPLTYTVAIVAAFLVTALVFIIYDCFVERRQLFVLAAARRSNQIVNSLFPENVRDRLLVESSSPKNAAQRTIAGQEQAQAPAAPKVQVMTELVTGMPKAVLHAARNPSVLIPDLRTIPNRISNVAAPFIPGAGAPTPQGRRGSREWHEPNRSSSATRSGKPIADFFPDTSVLFGMLDRVRFWVSQVSSAKIIRFCSVGKNSH